MNTSGSNWDDLSSRNERLVQPPESWSAQAGAVATARWAELDGQRERLAEAGQPSPGSRSASLRLVASAA
jgi:hypothetical protein